MILVGLLALAAAVWIFATFWGMILGAAGYIMSNKYKSGALPQKGTKYAEPPSHVNLLTPPKPYDWETDLEGWDGGDGLEVDGDI